MSMMRRAASEMDGVEERYLLDRLPLMVLTL